MVLFIFLLSWKFGSPVKTLQPFQVGTLFPSTLQTTRPGGAAGFLSLLSDKFSFLLSKLPHTHFESHVIRSCHPLPVTVAVIYQPLTHFSLFFSGFSSFLTVILSSPPNLVHLQPCPSQSMAAPYFQFLQPKSLMSSLSSLFLSCQSTKKRCYLCLQVYQPESDTCHHPKFPCSLRLPPGKLQ